MRVSQKLIGKRCGPAAGSVTRMLTQQHSAGIRFRFSLTTVKRLENVAASHLENLATELKRTSVVSIFLLTKSLSNGYATAVAYS